MRQYAHRLGPALGTTKTVIENLPGASSTIAAIQTLRSDPDGHALYLGSNVAQVLAPFMLKLSYDPLTALIPITQLTTNASLVAVSAQYGVKNWAEFLAKAKGEKDGVFYGTSNAGFQLPGVQMAKLAGIKLVNVPFKGGAETVTAVLSGNIPMIIGTPPSILPHVKAGTIIPLCVTTPERSSVMPDVPGANEVGLKGLDSSSWFGLYAPAKTPDAIIRKLHATIQPLMKDESLRNALAVEGMEVKGSASPEAFAAFQKEDYDKNAELIKEAGLAVK
nr:tripartite tricarboxylate transporter substrate binding protein [Variibacter gotjawalensis]